MRTWIPLELEGFNFKGRFTLEGEHDPARFTSGLSEKAKNNFETWLRETTTLVVNTEINVQVSTRSLNLEEL